MPKPLSVEDKKLVKQLKLPRADFGLWVSIACVIASAPAAFHFPDPKHGLYTLAFIAFVVMWGAMPFYWAFQIVRLNKVAEKISGTKGWNPFVAVPAMWFTYGSTGWLLWVAAAVMHLMLTPLQQKIHVLPANSPELSKQWIATLLGATGLVFIMTAIGALICGFGAFIAWRRIGRMLPASYAIDTTRHARIVAITLGLVAAAMAFLVGDMGATAFVPAMGLSVGYFLMGGLCTRIGAAHLKQVKMQKAPADVLPTESQSSESLQANVAETEGVRIAINQPQTDEQIIEYAKATVRETSE